MRAHSADMAVTAEQHTETWLQLSEATVLIDHNEQKARHRLERAIRASAASWPTPVDARS